MKKYLLFFFLLFSFPSLVFSQANDWLWATYGKAGYSYTGMCSDMLTVDNSGNCFYVGKLQEDSIHFGAYTLRNKFYHYFDIFLVKFDNNGNVLWAKQSQQNGNQSDGNGYVVSTDGAGNAYVMADFSDTLYFDSDTLKTQMEDVNVQGYYIDNFLVKYASNGNVIWARQSQIPSLFSDASGNSLATDQKGNSYVTGLFNDTVYFGNQTLIGVLSNINSPIRYTFLVKYDANGNVKWAEQSTGHSTYGSGGNCVVVNNSGEVLVSGSFNDSVTFGAFKLEAASSDADVFVVKYDTNGNVKWAKAGIFPSSHNVAQPEGMTADRFGNIYIAGYFWDTLIFEKDTIVNPELSAYNTSVFLVKYDVDGNVKWVKASTMLDNNPGGATALSCDNKGEVFMSGAGGGYGLSQICFGNDTLSIMDTAYLDFPSFLVKYDSSGNVLCASIVPCGGNGNSLNGMASDTSGNYVYLGGTAETTGIFGSDTVNPFKYYNGRIAATPFIARWKECEPTLGVENIVPKTNEIEVTVYPNPSNGNFELEITNYKQAKNNTTQVYNMLGEKVYSQVSTLNPLLSIDLSNQPNGVYLYRLITETGNLIGQGKLVIQR